MRRVISLVTLVGAMALTVGCDEKPNTTGSGSVTPGAKPGTGNLPVPPPPPPPPK